MGQLRSAVRALAGAGLGPGGGRPPSRHVRRAGRRRAQYATLAYAEVDPATGVVALAAAGHLPPVLLGDGSPRCSSAAARRRSASSSPTLPRTQASFTLAPGEGFILYTDGLVERRRESIDVGLDRLLAAIAPRRRAHPSWSPPCTSPTSENDDDVCVLAFHRT